MVTAALVSDTLSAIGAIGGLLSIVGVGLLILLVASQSRQIRAMREWIEQEPQRQQETAQRVIAEVQRRIAAARERRTTPAAPGVPPLPATPGAAGVKPAPGTLGATPEAQALAAKASGSPDGPETAIQGPGSPAFAPLTPAAGAEGSVPPPLSLDDEPAIVSEILGQETQAADVLDEEGLVPPTIPASRSRDQRYGEDQFDLEEEEPRSNRLLFGVGAVALLAGIVLILTTLLGGGDPKSPTTTANGDGNTPEATAKPRATPAGVDPSTVTVRVYNGTTITGLACRATNALKAADYSVGDPLTRGSNEVLNATIVMYRPNFKAAATQVAKDLKVAATGVQPIDAATSSEAGETAEVVVITGADYDDGSTGCSTTG
ncbi:MAG: LytR C-terminal domain-containing protein [Solirubrobacteraceae bacterium]|nr:LytR C-terminal domain-containing protein [Solirubrobacteraceae bacterium]